MTDNEFMLFDRLQKIKSTVEKYGAENFYISYSGGKDSNVLSELFDMALPGNDIPRVYCDTGIELNAVRDFVREKAAHDSRFIIIQPKVPIRKMLETVGYPFKSKQFSQHLMNFRKINKSISELPAKSFYRQFAEGTRITKSGKGKGLKSFDNCPNMLRYLFYEGAPFKISDQCCHELKENPLDTYRKEHNRPIAITGLTRAEGGGVIRFHVRHLRVINF